MIQLACGTLEEQLKLIYNSNYSSPMYIQNVSIFLIIQHFSPSSLHDKDQLKFFGVL